MQDCIVHPVLIPAYSQNLKVVCFSDDFQVVAANSPPSTVSTSRGDVVGLPSQPWQAVEPLALAVPDAGLPTSEILGIVSAGFDGLPFAGRFQRRGAPAYVFVPQEATFLYLLTRSSASPVVEVSSIEF